MRAIIVSILLCMCAITSFYSCKKKKTTECIIVNQTDTDSTIYFSDYGEGIFIQSRNEKTVHVGSEYDNKLSYPFESDIVRVKLNDSDTMLYFDEYNWTYLTNSNLYTKATYTFTKAVLNSMDEYSIQQN